MRKIALILSLFALASVAHAQITTTTPVGRDKIEHPDFRHQSGSALHTKVRNAWTKKSDDIAGRFRPFSAIADATLSTIDHNFGVLIDELTVIIYSGTHPTLTKTCHRTVSSDTCAGLGWIVAAGGTPNTEIDVTTPGSGGPHTFAVQILHDGGLGGAGGGGGGGTTVDAVLAENLTQGQVVELFDDGGVLKARGIQEAATGPVQTWTFPSSGYLRDRAYFNRGSAIDYRADDDVIFFLHYDSTPNPDEYMLHSFRNTGGLFELIDVDNIVFAENSSGNATMKRITSTVGGIGGTVQENPFILVYQAGVANNIRARQAWSNAASVVQFGTEATIAMDWTASGHGQVCDTTDERALFFATEQTTLDQRYTLLEPSGSSLTVSGPVTYETDNSLYTQCASDFTNGVVTAIFMETATGDIYAVKFTPNGGSPPTVGTRSLISSGGTSAVMGIVHVPSVDRYIIGRLTPNDTITYYLVSESGGTYTVEDSLAYVWPFNMSGGDRAGSLVYNSTTGKVYNWQTPSSFPGQPQGTEVVEISVTASTIDVKFLVENTTNTSSSGNTAQPEVVVLPDGRMIEAASLLNSAVLSEWKLKTQSEAAFQNWEKAEGVITETGLTGETKTVALDGAVASIYSGKTKGATGYLQSSGFVDETPEDINGEARVIGTFISDTDLLLNRSVTQPAGTDKGVSPFTTELSATNVSISSSRTATGRPIRLDGQSVDIAGVSELKYGNQAATVGEWIARKWYYYDGQIRSLQTSQSYETRDGALSAVADPGVKHFPIATYSAEVGSVTNVATLLMEGASFQNFGGVDRVTFDLSDGSVASGPHTPIPSVFGVNGYAPYNSGNNLVIYDDAFGQLSSFVGSPNYSLWISQPLFFGNCNNSAQTLSRHPSNPLKFYQIEQNKMCEYTMNAAGNFISDVVIHATLSGVPPLSTGGPSALNVGDNLIYTCDNGILAAVNYVTGAWTTLFNQPACNYYNNGPNGGGMAFDDINDILYVWHTPYDDVFRAYSVTVSGTTFTAAPGSNVTAAATVNRSGTNNDEYFEQSVTLQQIDTVTNEFFSDDRILDVLETSVSSPERLFSYVDRDGPEVGPIFKTFPDCGPDDLYCQRADPSNINTQNPACNLNCTTCEVRYVRFTRFNNHIIGGAEVRINAPVAGNTRCAFDTPEDMDFSGIATVTYGGCTLKDNNGEQGVGAYLRHSTARDIVSVDMPAGLVGTNALYYCWYQRALDADNLDVTRP